MKRILVAVAIFLSSICVNGQAVRFDLPVQTINTNIPTPGNMYPVLAIPNTTVAVCNYPAVGVPCTNYATTYNNISEGAVCSYPTQLTRPTTSTCASLSDSSGNWGVWITPGTYAYTITTTYGSFGPYPFTVGGTGSGGGGGVGPSTAIQTSNGGGGIVASLAKADTSGKVTAPVIEGNIFADQQISGGGNNGIANSIALCNSLGFGGCYITSPVLYGATEQYNFTSMIPSVPAQTHFHDDRGGGSVDFYHQWGNTLGFGSQGAAWSQNCLNDKYPSSPITNTHDCFDMVYNSTDPGWSNGSNGHLFPYWRVNHVGQMSITSNGSGIDQAFAYSLNGYGLGDKIGSYCYVTANGGWTAPADEGVKCWGGNVQETPATYQATCTTGCSTGSTIVKTTATGGSGNQGTGLYLTDLTSAQNVTTSVTSFAAGYNGAEAVAVAATLPVSNAWGTLNADCSPTANPYAPPFTQSTTCNITLTSGTFDTTHLACFASAYHECVIPSAVGTPSGGVQSVTFPLRRIHYNGGSVFQGGMAGYGADYTFLDQLVNGFTLRYPYDIIGSTDAHTLQTIMFVATGTRAANDFSTTMLGNWSIINLSNSGTTVSGTFSGTANLITNPSLYNLGTWLIAGASDSAFNTSCTNTTWTSGVAFTCTIAGLSGTHTAATATASFGQNNVILRPIAEVIDIQNETTTPPIMDGTLALEPNILQLALNDNLQQLHPLAVQFQAFTNNLKVWNPLNQWNGWGINVSGAGVGGGADNPSSNALISTYNANPDSMYYGNGGTNDPPNLWNHVGGYANGFIMSEGPAPGSSWMHMHMSTIQQNNPLYGFNLFMLGGRGNDFACGLNYTPYSSWLLFYGCSTIQFPSTATMLMPAFGLTTTANMASTTSFNYAPYSNTLNGATWANTASGSGSVTCTIADDLGDPACTLTATAVPFNWQEFNMTGYTALTPGQTYTIQARVKGTTGTEVFTIGFSATSSAHFTPSATQWQNYCYSFPATVGNTARTAAINMINTGTIYVSNVSVRPDGNCGPLIITTNNQVLVATPVNAINNSPICTPANGFCSNTANIVGSAEVATFSGTPTFSLTTNVSRVTLTGNITSFTLGTPATDGQSKVLCFLQGAGPYTVTPPSNVHGFFTIGVTNNLWNCQSYVWDNVDSIWAATGPGVINE